MTTDELAAGITLDSSGRHRVTDSNIYRVRRAPRAANPRPGRGPIRSVALARHESAAASPAASPAKAAPQHATAVAEPFDAYYFAHCCGRPYGRDPEWLEFFGAIADRIAGDIRPRRVLDAGCAYGLLVDALRDRGVDAWGIDISAHAIAQVHESARPYCRRGSITDDFTERYDLIVCIEVLEHVAPHDAERALDNICRHTDDVLFSSTPRDYEEPTHVNVNPPEHWAESFARRGFYRDVDYDASHITSWAARFRRSSEPMHRLVRDYERRTAIVLAERADNRRFTARVQRELASALRALEEMRQTHASQVAALAAQIEHTAGELHEAQQAVTVADDRIAHMERSAFWKMRRLWVRVAGALGRRT
jgi:SAM-dependent methyltransferase